MRIRSVQSPYRISLSYGYHVGYPLNDGFHRGTDYVSEDLKIVSPQDSEVVALGYDKINGNYLVLQSGDFRDWFSHIKTYNVEIGQKVKMGQQLAIMGKTGYATGVHNHHSLRYKGIMVDPEEYIMTDALSREECNAIYMLAFDVNQASVNKDVVRAFIGKPVQELLTYLLQDPSYKSHKERVNNSSSFKKVTEQLYRRV